MIVGSVVRIDMRSVRGIRACPVSVKLCVSHNAGVGLPKNSTREVNIDVLYTRDNVPTKLPPLQAQQCKNIADPSPPDRTVIY